MKKTLFLSLIITFIISCSIEPEPISYGDDKCDFCTMNIVDKPYGAEVVTDKGKVYKFDSTECMLNYINEHDATYALKLTNTMDKPGELMDATTSYYLISEKLPSPMGANITAFSTQALAEEGQKNYGGEVLSFNDLKEHQAKHPSGGINSHTH